MEMEFGRSMAPPPAPAIAGKTRRITAPYEDVLDFPTAARPGVGRRTFCKPATSRIEQNN